MSFASFHIRKKTRIQMQFRAFSTDGILFYVIQNLTAQSGKVGRIFVSGRGTGGGTREGGQGRREGRGEGEKNPNEFPLVH